MKIRSFIVTLVLMLVCLGTAHSQTQEDTQKAHLLRASATYLEMKGDFAKALQQYEESLRYVYDEAIEKKIAELRSKSEITENEITEVPPNSNPELPPAIPFNENEAGMVFSKLDLNPYYLTYLNTEGILLPLRKELLSLASEIRESVKEESEESKVIDAFTEKIDPLLEWSGVYSIQSLGMSMAPQENKVTRVRLFLHLDEEGKDSALRQLMGEPSELPGLNYLPKDTALAFASTLSINRFWNVLKEGMETFAPPEVNKQRDAVLITFKEQLDIDIEALISTLSDECLVGIKLDRNKTISIDVSDTDSLEIPEPSLIVALKVDDTSIFEMVRDLLANNGTPPTTIKIAGEKAISIPAPAPIPVKVEPTLMMHGGYLLLASTPEMMEEAINSSVERSGLRQSDEYLVSLGDIPERISGIRFVSNRFYRTISDIATRLLQSEFETESEKKELGPLKNQLLQIINSSADIEIASYLVTDSEGIFSESNVKTATGNLLFDQLKQPVKGLMIVAIQAAKAKRLEGIKDECHTNLSIIEDAKYLWSEEHGNPVEAPTQADLEPYIDGPFPTCPDGGIYTINEVDVPATCDKHPYE